MELKSLPAPSSSKIGIDPDRVERYLMNRTGSATFVGQVLAVDLRSAASESGSEYSPSKSETGCFGNGVLPSGTDITCGQCAIVLEVVADDKPVLCMFRGIDSGFVLRQAGSGSVATGDPLVIDTAGKLDATVAAGEKYFAKFLEDTATIDGTGGLHRVLFDGLTGFGVFYAS